MGRAGVTTILRQLHSVPMWASVLRSGSSDPHSQCAGAPRETEARSHRVGRVGQWRTDVTHGPLGPGTGMGPWHAGMMGEGCQLGRVCVSVPTASICPPFPGGGPQSQEEVPVPGRRLPSPRGGCPPSQGKFPIQRGGLLSSCLRTTPPHPGTHSTSSLPSRPPSPRVFTGPVVPTHRLLVWAHHPCRVTMSSLASGPCIGIY